MAVNQYVNCEVCTFQFNDREFIPLVLKCGHTFCRQCIREISIRNRLCPKCRRLINEPIHKVPINYSLMEFLNLNVSSTCFISDTRRIRCLLLKQTDDFSKIITNFSTHLGVIQNNISVLDEMKISNAEEGNEWFTKYNKIKEDSKKTEEVLQNKITYSKYFSSLETSKGCTFSLQDINESLEISTLQDFTDDMQILINLLSNQTNDILKLVFKLSTNMLSTLNNMNFLVEIIYSDVIENELFKKIYTILEDYKTAQELLQKDTLSISLSITFPQSNEFILFFLQNIIKSQDLLQSIFKMVQSGMVIYTQHQIFGETKYGKISIQENTILLHCLELSNIPSTSHAIQFKLLKKLLLQQKLHTFITLSYNNSTTSTIIIEMLKKDRKLTNIFTYLCTGEMGGSYKDDNILICSNPTRCCCYSADCLHLMDVVTLPQIDFDIYTDIEDYEKCILRDKVQDYKSNKIFVESLTDSGIFSFVSSVGRQDKMFYIGHVISPKNFSEQLSNNKKEIYISDCGLALSI